MQHKHDCVAAARILRAFAFILFTPSVTDYYTIIPPTQKDLSNWNLCVHASLHMPRPPFLLLQQTLRRNNSAVLPIRLPIILPLFPLLSPVVF